MRREYRTVLTSHLQKWRMRIDGRERFFTISHKNRTVELLRYGMPVITYTKFAPGVNPFLDELLTQ